MSIYGKDTNQEELTEYGFYPYLRLYDLARLGDGSLTLAAYVRFANMRDGVCWASAKSIAELIGVSERTVTTHTKLLLENGYLRICGKRKQSVKYRTTSKLQKTKAPVLRLPEIIARCKPETISQACKRVFADLLYRAEPSGDLPKRVDIGGETVKVKHGAEALAADSGLTVRHVRRSMKRLCELGLIERSGVTKNDATTKVKLQKISHPDIVNPSHGGIETPVPCTRVASTLYSRRQYPVTVADELERKPGQSKNTNQNPDLNQAGDSSFGSREGGISTKTTATTSENGAALPPANERELPSENANGSPAVDYVRIAQMLLSHCSARELQSNDHNLLAILASAAQAQIENDPVVEECPLSRLLVIVGKEDNPDDPVRDWNRVLRYRLDKANLSRTKAWLFEGSKGALFFRAHIEQLLDVLKPIAESEQAAREASLCVCCKIKPGIFRGPQNELLCFDRWKSPTEFCTPTSRRKDEDSWRQAVNRARDEIRNGALCTVHPRIWSEVLAQVSEDLDENKWREWNSDEQLDRLLDLKAVTDEPGSLRVHIAVLERLQAFTSPKKASPIICDDCEPELCEA